MSAPLNPSASSDLRRKLLAAHSDLLAIHKALLDHERAGYEQKNGKIGNPGEVLQRVINDPWFAWLKPMTALIVQIDEYTEGDDPLDAGQGEALLVQARTLLTADENGGPFQREYFRVLQQSPEAAALHGLWRHSQQTRA
jgi:hypothetical protein